MDIDLENPTAIWIDVLGLVVFAVNLLNKKPLTDYVAQLFSNFKA